MNITACRPFTGTPAPARTTCRTSFQTRIRESAHTAMQTRENNSSLSLFILRTEARARGVGRPRALPGSVARTVRDDGLGFFGVGGVSCGSRGTELDRAL